MVSMTFGHVFAGWRLPDACYDTTHAQRLIPATQRTSAKLSIYCTIQIMIYLLQMVYLVYTVDHELSMVVDPFIILFVLLRGIVVNRTKYC